MSEILKPSHDEWGTPKELFLFLNEEFDFDIDAAATEENTLLPYYITPEMDALVYPWGNKGYEASEVWPFRVENVWCNPPYSKLGPFVQRGYEEHLANKNTVVMLIPAYTDPRYWSEYVMRAHEVRFLKGRLQYLENGQKKQSARFPSVVVIFKYIPGAFYGKAPNQFVWDWRAVA